MKVRACSIAFLLGAIVNANLQAALRSESFGPSQPQVLIVPTSAKAPVLASILKIMKPVEFVT